MPLEQFANPAQEAYVANPLEFTKNSLLDEWRNVAATGDRQEVASHIKYIMQDPAMQGMSFKDVGQMMNNAIGGQDKAGFDRFRSSTRWLEAAGYNIMEGGKRSLGQYTGAAMEGLGSLFTDDEAGLEQWRQAGEYIPGGIGLLASAFIPGVGIPAMLGLTYGAGTEGARARGVGGWAAPAAGAIDTAINLAFIKGAPMVSGRIADHMVKRLGTAKAISDISKQTGKSLYESALEGGKLSARQRFGIEVASHATTEGGMAVLGTAGSAMREMLLYSQEGRENWMQEWWDELAANPHFWTTSLITEAGFAFVGHVVGRGINSRVARARNVGQRGATPDGTTTPGDDPGSVLDVDPSVAAAMERHKVAVENVTPIKQAPSAEDSGKLGSFSTERKSQYAYYEDGTTQRNQVSVPDQGITGGIKPKSEQTVFIDDNVAAQVEGIELAKDQSIRIQLSEDGNTLTVHRVEGGKIVDTPLSDIAISRQPELGSHPMELSNMDTREGSVPGARNRYIGTKIEIISRPKVEIPDTIPAEVADVVPNPFGTPDPLIEAAQLRFQRRMDTAEASTTNQKWQDATETTLNPDGTAPNEAIVPKVAPADQLILMAGNASDIADGSPTNQNPVKKALDPVRHNDDPQTAIRKKVVDALRVVDTREFQGGVKIAGVGTNRLVLNKAGNEVVLSRRFFDQPVDPSQFPDADLQATAVQMHQEYHTFFKKFQSQPQRLVFDDSNYTDSMRKSWIDFTQNSGIRNALSMVKGTVVFADAKNSTSWQLTFVGEPRAKLTTIFDETGPTFVISSDATRMGTLHEMGHVVDQLIRYNGFGAEARVQWENLIEGAFAETSRIGAVKLTRDIQKAGETPMTGIEKLDAYYRTRRELAANAFQGYMLDAKTPFRKFMAENFPLLDKLFGKIVDAFRKSSNFIKDPNRTAREQYLANEYSLGGIQTRKFFEQIFETNRAKPSEYAQDFNNYIKQKLDPALYEKALEVFSDANPQEQKIIFDAVRILDEPGMSIEIARPMIEQHLSMLNSVNKVDLTGETLGRLMQLAEDRATGKKVPRTVEDLMAPEDGANEWPNLRDVANLGRTHRATIALQQAVSHHVRQSEYVMDPSNMDRSQLIKNMDSQRQLLSFIAQMDTVAGKWLKGELEGQEGRPAWDKGQLLGDDAQFSYGFKGDSDSYQVGIDRALAETQRHYPILWKHLSKIESGKAVLEQGFVYLDGQGNRGFKLTSETNVRKAKRAKFESREEADAYREVLVASGEYSGLVFDIVPMKRKVKGQADETLYEIKGSKGKQGESFAKWEDVMESRSLTDWILKGFPNDPGAAKHIKGVGETLKKTGVQEGGLAKYFSQVVRSVMKDYKNSLLLPTGNSEFLRLTRSVDKFDSLTGNDMYVAKWRKQLEKDLGLAEGTDTVDLMLRTIEHSYDDPGFVADLQTMSPQAWVEMSESFGNFAYNVFRSEVELDIFRQSKGLPAQYKPADYDIKKTGVDRMSPLENADVSKGVEVLQMHSETAVNSKMLAGVVFGKGNGNILQRMLMKAENYFQDVMGNIIQLGETNPLGRPFGEAVVHEQAHINVHGTDAVENYHHAGKVVQTEDGMRFIKDTQGVVNRDAYLTVHAFPELKSLFDNIRRLEQESGMSFEQLSKFEAKSENDVVLAQDVAELKQSLDAYAKKAGDKADQHMTHLNEFILRSHAANLASGRHVVQSLRDFQTETLAGTLFKATTNPDIRPEHAQAIAREISKLTPQPDGTDPMRAERIKLVQQITGWDGQVAAKYDVTWRRGFDAITQYGVMREQSPWYVTERRHRRYTVPYVVKTAKGEEAQTGMRDFDTPAEAEAFIRSAESQGLKPTVKNAKDSWRLRSRSKPFADAAQEAINHVVDSKAELMDIALHSQVESGAMTQEKATQLVNNIKNIKHDIEMEMNAELDSGQAQRYFKHGREHLDMTYQQIRGTWQEAIKFTRLRTDAIYRLYGDDPVRQADKRLMSRAEGAREMLRIADGTMQQRASKAAFTLFMGANFSTGFIEAVQYPISLSHVLIENGLPIKDAFTIPLQMARFAGKASMNRIGGKVDTHVWTNPHHLKLIRTAEKMGRMNVRNYMDINENVMKSVLENYAHMANPGALPKTNHLAEQAYKGVATFYGAFNRFNAELSLTSSFEALKKAKYGKKKITDAQAEELYSRAMEISDIANGAHGRAGRPIWFNTRSEGMRTVAQMAWSLQSYSQSYVATWMRLITSSFAGKVKGKSSQEITQSRKALATMTGIQLGAFGVMGIPLVGGITKAMQMAFGFDPEYELKSFLDDEYNLEPEENLALADAMLYGVQRATGIPVDLRSRMAITGVGPLSEYEGFKASSMGGPLMSLAASNIAAFKNIQSGDDSMARHGINFLPAGVQRGIRMMFFDDGNVYTKAGKYVMEPDTWETIGAIGGFSPTRYIDHVRSTTKQRHAATLDSVENSKAAQRLMQMLQQPGGEMRAQEELLYEAERLNVQPSVLANRVVQKTMERLYGPQVREGRGPEAQRAARLYQSPLPQASNVDLDMTRFSTLSKLNQMPRNWESTLARSRQADALVSQTGMTNAQARRFVSEQGGRGNPTGLTGAVYGSDWD